jgi:hypothetical protein
MRTGHQPIAVQLLDHFVVVGIILSTATGVSHAGDTQAVQLAHEVSR